MDEDTNKKITELAMNFISYYNSILELYNEKYTGYKIEGSSAGWTTYVGSNYESYGEWFLEPEFTQQINSKEFTPNNLHTYFLDKGIEK